MKIFRFILISISIVLTGLYFSEPPLRNWCYSIAFNSICFLDNSIDIKSNINPIFIWAIIFFIIGAFYGMARAVNRLNLNRTIKIVGIACPFLILLFIASISKPLEMGNSRYFSEEFFWAQIDTSKSFFLCIQYINKFPNGAHISQVKIKQEQNLWDSAVASKISSTWDLYLKEFPESARIKKAKKNYERILWGETKALNTLDAYNNYLDKCPRGINVYGAKSAIIKLKREKGDRFY
jgi:hypothetical protein